VRKSLPPKRRRWSRRTPVFRRRVGSFNVTQLGYSADKIGKDTDFRGVTIFNNVVYDTKGSGGNGINTVYFLDRTGFDSYDEAARMPE
jgi:hypothetical protein